MKSICKVQLPAQIETNMSKPKMLRWADEGFKHYSILIIGLKCAKYQYPENSDCESVES